MGIEDFPRYVRYDFFMAILGLLMFYFSFSNENIYNNFFFHWLLIIIGIICFIYGLYQMKKNYIKEQEIEDLRKNKERLEIKEVLKSRNEN